MTDSPDTVPLVETAHAKVNLWLEVMGRRPDGFHDLETVMHEVDLADEVRLCRAGRGSISRSTTRRSRRTSRISSSRPSERSNVKSGRDLPCRIELRKRIPAGGGLGGGSSDAAAVIATS